MAKTSIKQETDDVVGQGNPDGRDDGGDRPVHPGVLAEGGDATEQDPVQ